MSPERQRIVIIGGGIIGCSTAYYLTKTPQFKDNLLDVTLVEAIGIASAASGYAGGCLARDWHGKETSALGKLSFKCHQELASLYDGHKHWGYSQTTALSLTAREASPNLTNGKQDLDRGESEWLDGVGGIRTRQGGKKDIDGIIPKSFDWIDRQHLTGVSVMDSETAQINPLKFTQFLSAESQRRGVKLVIGTVVSVSHVNDKLQSVTLANGRIISCDKILLSAGPWTGRLHDSLFPDLPSLNISSFAGTSLLLQTTKSSLSPFGAFGAVTMSDGDAVEIEFFGREDGQIWIGGVNDHSTLPEASAGIEPCVVDTDRLTRISRLLFPDATVCRTSKCYRPINSSSASNKDVPIMKQVQKGVFVCAGHSVWGISLGPGSGLVMSRMMMGQPIGCDISALQV